jgi:NADH-quinone oxidoreductase subunit K
VLSLILLGIGIYGFLFRKNVLLLLMSLEIMANAANLALVAFTRMWGFASTRMAFVPGGARELVPFAPIGHVFVIFSITIAVAEAAIGLALIVLLYRRFRSVDVDRFTVLKW